MTPESQELAVYIKPCNNVLHRWTDGEWYWHSVSMTPFEHDVTYVRSKYKHSPEGVYVVRRYNNSSIHYVITSES